MVNSEILSKFNLEEAISMARRGCSQLAIANHFGIKGAQRISDCFKYYGVHFEKRTFPINDTFFDNIDSEEKAYCLGYLVADGCVKHEKRKSGGFSYRIAFNNSIDDKEAIDLIHNLICPEAKIVLSKNLHNRRKKPQYTLQWSSKYMCDKLEEKYKIKPRKTYDKDFYIPEGTIPDDMWRHFIRGFFDGDGHIGYCSMEFVFTSKPFMLQVLQWFSSFNYHIIEIEGKTTRYWKAAIPVNDKVKKAIKDFFYKDAHYYLKRKYDSFNTEITYSITNRVISIVEHRVE